MIKQNRLSARTLLLALCAAALAVASLTAAPASAQSTNQRPQNTPPKKKLPQGQRGFDQFAPRDASEKLIAGGATRDLCETRTAETAVKCGTSLLGEEKYAEAVEVLSKAVQLDPAMFRARFRLGMAYEGLGRYKEAAESYRMALGLKPDTTVDAPEEPLFAQYNLANSYALAGQHREAVEIYHKLIAALPAPVSTPYYNLGLSLAALNDEAGAVEAFKKAIEIKSDYAEAHYNLGIIYSRAEKYPEAVAEFQQAIKAKPDYAEARYSLGIVYYLTDNRTGLVEQQKALQEMKSKLAEDLARLGGK